MQTDNPNRQTYYIVCSEYKSRGKEMKILIVEDELRLREMLVTILSKQQYLVDAASDGLAALRLLESRAYDLLLLDINLPQIDGLTLCQRMRSNGFQGVILLVTGENKSGDIIRGLDSGADDYITKPFNSQELLARIRASVRRANIDAVESWQWGELQINFKTKEVTFGQQNAILTATEYSLLSLLTSQPNRVFSYDDMIDYTWFGKEPPTENTIRTHIKQLRKKLKAAGLQEEVIVAIYGLGYRFMREGNFSQNQGKITAS
ncbi:response regulator transcription factor [bacterium]|nr:response regulator transcription factor [bacterium]